MGRKSNPQSSSWRDRTWQIFLTNLRNYWLAYEGCCHFTKEDSIKSCRGVKRGMMAGNEQFRYKKKHFKLI